MLPSKWKQEFSAGPLSAGTFSAGAEKQPQTPIREQQQAYTVDGCSLIAWKMSGKETGWGYLHIKGAVLGTFEDQTPNRNSR